jgi:hypothetical protein
VAGHHEGENLGQERGVDEEPAEPDDGGDGQADHGQLGRR